MKFNDIKSLLLHQERTVVFKSLTSEKTHTIKCTIKKDIQSDSSKVLVYDLTRGVMMDIECSTIESII